jgi:hypothetical protein
MENPFASFFLYEKQYPYHFHLVVAYNNKISELGAQSQF